MPTDPSMTDYAGDPNLWPEVFRLISGATRGYADRLAAALEALADRTAWQRARLTDPLLVPLFGAKQSTVGAGLIERFEPWATEPTPGFTYTERAGWLQTDITDGGGLWWLLPVKEQIQITMIAASIDGSDGPGSNPGFPAAGDRPRMRLYRQPTDGSPSELLLTLADETASQGEYQQHHTIPKNPTIPFVSPLSFAAGEYLIIEFVGHKGAQVAPATLKLYGIEITSELA